MRQAKTQNPKRSKPAPAEAQRPRTSPGIIELVVCAALVTASGVFHGVWTGRWKLSDQPAKAAERLVQVPLVIGDWDGNDHEINSRQIGAAGAAGYLSRRYVNRQTGDVVWATVLCGPPGPIAVHPPDICFRGVGFQPAENPMRHTISRPSQPEAAEVWSAKFVKNEPTGAVAMRILWAWSATGAWLAPDNPRLTFARHKVLYKLYLQRAVSPEPNPGEQAQLDGFARLFLENLNRSLFPVAQNQDGSKDLN